jgi:membrane protein required for colicin V production
MNPFDILVLIVVAISAILAFARGFIREVLSMTALVAGIMAALWALPVLRDTVRTMIESPGIADTATVVGVFLLVYVAVRVLTGRIHEWVHDSEPLGILDRSAGILFGVARGFAIASIPVMLVTSATKKVDNYPKIMTQAQFYPFLYLTAEAIIGLTPYAAQGAGDLAKNAASAGEEAAKWRNQAEMLKDASDAVSQATSSPSFEPNQENNSTNTKNSGDKSQKNDKASQKNNQNSLKIESK